ncbi:hypothetical protein SAY87_007315 [Trapa incisa]|uniref:Protein kinase domain-containing protein n=1 Tax=Trapa incisa TaxID=236973 RepID=A0AAN7Q0Q6_9MYRT|nr:hypothetical protein SAY87_007315 [Trapa incisa]
MTFLEQMQVKAMAEEKEKKCVLVGIRFDSQTKDLLNWALVKVANPGDRVVVLHVCHRDQALQEQNILDDYLEVYEGLCSAKKLSLLGLILHGSSIRQSLVREAKKLCAAVLLVGIKRHSVLGGSTRTAKYCAKRLPRSTDVLAIHNGKIVFRRSCDYQIPGVLQDPRPSLDATASPQGIQSNFIDSEVDTENSGSEANLSFRDRPLQSISFGHGSSRISSLPTSECIGNHLDPRPGWPLLRKVAVEAPLTVGRRDKSVVQWVMSLPDRSHSIPMTPTSTSRSSTFGSSIHRIYSSAEDQVLKEMELLLSRNISTLVWIDFELLCRSTSQFSSENLIGKGGCNHVYRGTLSDGNEVAVKAMKSSQGSRKDFALEIDIISSLQHRFITPLRGICIRHDSLFSVYDFFRRGSLEENLHGDKMDECGLPWKVRYSIALGVAEALNYLHNEIPQPVVHRDIKSSNILLTDDFKPKVSDFGLAMWASTTSPFLQADLVGTFGYLAPEYFMSGKVSDRIDVYSYGVVVLELLSGRKPIYSEASKGQESLVVWAKPMIESKDMRGILDHRLHGDIDETELKRMVIAASLCLRPAARLRPSISQILKLLLGECDMDAIANSDNACLQRSENADDDEVYPESCAASHLGIALLDICDDFTSFSSLEQQSNSMSMEEYIKGRMSRSPSSS